MNLQHGEAEGEVSGSLIAEGGGDRAHRMKWPVTAALRPAGVDQG
jgi:hypothetical protein